MKRIVTIFNVILLIFATSNFAQGKRGPGEYGRMSGKIEQLEKIKIIEELNMDEETMLKFFSRRSEHRENQHSLLEKRDRLYDNLSEEFNSGSDINYKEKAVEIFNIEREMLIQREEFFKSLNDILTEKEMVQLIIFEFNFRNEIRNQFLKQNQMRRRPK